MALRRGWIRDTQEVGYLNKRNYKFEIRAFEVYRVVLLAMSADIYKSESNVHTGRGYDDKGYGCRWVLTRKIIPKALCR